MHKIKIHVVCHVVQAYLICYSLDSWFVPAMSAVAESESLLKQVIPQDQGFSEHQKYAGIFRFRFWFGRWIGNLKCSMKRDCW